MKDRIRNLEAHLLNRSWTTLQNFTYEFEVAPGVWQKQKREAYDRGNGVCALLYDSQRKKVLLAKQFRLPTFLNGNESGELIEVCAGKLSTDEDPLEGIQREVNEELGHTGLKFEKVLESYMSPGSVTEKIFFYLAEYSPETKSSQGGGLPSEQENISVLEIDLEESLQMIQNGDIQDAKTIILLQHLKLKLIADKKEKP